ncbi:MAG: hypothetical protein KF693_05185 [Nitrospira sp.]|nr:hypothetical protein [Nitrospira sp.]
MAQPTNKPVAELSRARAKNEVFQFAVTKMSFIKNTQRMLMNHGLDLATPEQLETDWAEFKDRISQLRSFYHVPGPRPVKRSINK